MSALNIPPSAGQNFGNLFFGTLRTTMYRPIGQDHISKGSISNGKIPLPAKITAFQP